MKLSTRISAIFLLLLLVISAVLLSTVYLVLKNKVINNAIQSLNRSSIQISHHLEDFINSRDLALQIISRDSVIASANSSVSELRRNLLEYRNSFKLVNTISIFNPDGVRISSSQGLDIGEKIPLELRHMDFLSMKNGINDKVHISYTQKIPAIYGFFYLLDKNGQIFRIIQIVTPLSVLQNFLMRINAFTNNEKIDLIDNRGLLIYSNIDKSGVLKRKVDIRRLFEDENKTLGSNPLSFIRYDNQAKDTLLESFIVIKGFSDPSQRWILRVSIPEKAVLQSVYQFIEILISITVAIIILSMIPIFILGKKISFPIRKFAEAIARIGKGEYEEKIQIKFSEEFGILTTAFNAMTENLASSREQLNNYNERLEILVEAKTVALNKALEETEKKNSDLNETKNRLEALSKNLEDKVKEKTFYLIREKQKLLTAQEISRSAVFEYDIFNDSFDWSEGVQKILDQQPSNKAKSMDAILEFIHPDDLNRFQDECDLALKKGEINETYRIITKDEKVKWVKLASKIYYLENNQPSMALGAITDITETIESLKKLSNLQEQLFQSEKMEAIGLLANGISHDFNRIVSNIVGLSDLILSDPEKIGEKEKNFLLEIKKQGELGAEVAKQVLNFSKPKIESFAHLDLMSLCQNTLKLLHSSLYYAAEVSVKQIPAKLPQILGSEIQIQQLLMNLCINACDAMDGKWGKLDIIIDEVVFDAKSAFDNSVREGPYLVISVKDSGHGMSEEVKRRIFEPFFTTKNEKGTGMGLSVVKRVVDNHNGAIQIESEVGSGTTINIFFPVLKDDDSIFKF